MAKAIVKVASSVVRPKENGATVALKRPKLAEIRPVKKP
jgi:hypothetical protein